MAKKGVFLKPPPLSLARPVRKNMWNWNAMACRDLGSQCGCYTRRLDQALSDSRAVHKQAAHVWSTSVQCCRREQAKQTGETADLGVQLALLAGACRGVQVHLVQREHLWMAHFLVLAQGRREVVVLCLQHLRTRESASRLLTEMLQLRGSSNEPHRTPRRPAVQNCSPGPAQQT